ncbi:MAG TPA: hypothetical protein VNI55_10480 [Gaiellaceae bacterium]|nr:hypothetical protein [Gaiellaceae bacterium]
MKRITLITLLALGLILLALAGWIIRGLRFVFAGGPRRRTRLAPA